MKRLVAAALAAVSCAAAAADPAPGPAKEATPPPQTRQLRLLQGGMPAFPTQMIQGGACVTVKLSIRHDGFVSDVTVLEARPPELAEPTIAALKQWWFQSFPPPDVTAVQTFTFSPELVRLPESAIAPSFGTVGDGGALTNQGCGTGKPAVSAAAPAPEAKKGKK